MTDHMIHADNLARNIRTVVDLATAPGNHYTKADVIDHLEALLPKPPTLADELSEFAESLLAGASVSDVELQLIRFADRVETLEQERDEAQAEIARLRAREIPNGWRVADHPHYGTVLTDGCQDEHGNLAIHLIADNGRSMLTRINPSDLSFRDEAPAPEPEGDYITGGLADSKLEGIDPASFGRYRPYLVKINEREARAIRIDDDHRPWLRLGHGNYHSDSQVKVIRPLTSEEMDAR